MKKRHHHYVWRHYLTVWATNEKIWCLSDGKIFNPNVKNIAQERDFYRLKELSPNDVAFVTSFIVANQNPLLQSLNRKWLWLFNFVFEIRKLALDLGISKEQADAHLDTFINNQEEDLHQSIESNAIQYVDALRSTDVNFLSTDEGYSQFIHYLCVQYFRTRKIRDSVLANVQGDKLLGVLNPEAMWGVFRHILATNVGWTLFAERNEIKPVLITSNADEQFVTSDQPVINTHATGVSAAEFVNDLEFYYPVSPRLALLLTKNTAYSSLSIVAASSEEVRHYNQRMFSHAHSQVYGASKGALAKYLSGQ